MRLYPPVAIELPLAAGAIYPEAATRAGRLPGGSESADLLRRR